MAGGGLVPVVRTKEVKPEGAEEHAAALRKVAALCRRLADDIRLQRSVLADVWQGKSHNRFLYDEGFNSSPDELDRHADWLEDEACQVDRKTVIVEYTVMVPVSEAWE